MRSFNRLAGLALLAFMATAACAPFQDATTWLNNQLTTGSAPQANSVAAAEGFYTAADKALTATINSGVLSPAIVTSIMKLDNDTYAALVPLRQAAENGNSVALPALLAAYNAAFGKLYDAAQGNGIAITLPPGPTSRLLKPDPKAPAWVSLSPSAGAAEKLAMDGGAL